MCLVYVYYITHSKYLSTPVNNSPTIIYEDNTTCVEQVKEGFIKRDKTKHISPKFFYTHELQESKQVDVKQIRFADNLADLFTKALDRKSTRLNSSHRP